MRLIENRAVETKGVPLPALVRLEDAASRLGGTILASNGTPRRLDRPVIVKAHSGFETEVDHRAVVEGRVGVPAGLGVAVAGRAAVQMVEWGVPGNNGAQGSGSGGGFEKRYRIVLLSRDPPEQMPGLHLLVRPRSHAHACHRGQMSC